MKTIFQNIGIAAKMLGEQMPIRQAIYRPYFYVISHPVPNGVLLYHTVTKELIFLEKTEAAAFGKAPFDGDPVREYLIRHYFLTLESNDDKQLMLQTQQAMDAVRNLYTAPKLASLVIFTTSDCNARCFYCFERGTRKVKMTEQTAYDVAEFIRNKCENNVHIRWFGGEPLYNDKVIDIISSELRKNAVAFHATMVTNGYLFDDEMVSRAVSLWNLKRVQITLDGTEQVYNRIKNYIYKDDPSPFIRVLDNIERLLKADISVQIRLNMDLHNAEDLRTLCEQLVERFSSYEKCHIYVKLLYEDTCDSIQNRDAEDRHPLIRKSIELPQFIDARMPKPIIPALSDFRRENFCMTDNDQSAMIFSDGSLGKCEHYTEDDFYGSIYSDKIDFENIRYHKQMTTVVPECDDCAYRNICMHPVCCTSNRATRCDELDKIMVKNRLASKMDNIYRKFTENQQKNLETNT